MLGYYMFPDVRGNLLAFTSDDDIWLLNLERKDNRPIRLTSGLGVSIRPKISPDGKKIAFTALWLKSGKSSSDVFVLGDGEAKRVTYFGRNSRVAGWLSENEILVITDFHTPFTQWTEAYKVNVNDGSFEKLPYGIVSNIVMSNDIIILARGYQDLPFWKGYKGGTKGELWISYDGGKSFNKFVSLNGIVSWPMIVKGRVYFLSDHEGVANLYSVDLDGKDLKKHTNFTEYYCRNASSDGEKIVFQNAGDIYIYYPEKESLEKVEIDLPTDRKKRQPKFVSVTEYLTEVSTNNNYVGIISRGKVFLMKPWDGPSVQLGEKQGVKYRQIQILPSNEVLVVNSNDDKLVILGKDSKKIDIDFGRIERINVSPDGKKVLISNNRQELWLYEIENNSAKLIDKSEYNIIFEMDWHPDSEWFAYSFPEGHQVRSIKLGHISGKTIRITTPYGYDFSPSFDPDGRYLYFLSARHLEATDDKAIFNLSFQKVVKPYLVVLSNSYSPFNQPLEQVSDKKGIEVEGIQDRVLPFPVNEDNYVKIAGAKNNKVFLLSYPIRNVRSFSDEGNGKLEVYDLDSKSKETYADNLNDFVLSNDKSKIILMFKDTLRMFDVNSKPDLNSQGRKGGVIDLTRVKVLVEFDKEWRQMLKETWKLMKQNYWNENKLEGWNSVLPKYERLLDRISTRYELSDLIQEMQGETKTSHSYEFPYDYDTQEPLQVGGLGAEFEYDNGCFRITKIYVGDPTNENERSPLRDPGVQLNVGDCIKAIDGEDVGNNAIKNIYYYLFNKDQIILDVITKDGASRRVSVKVLHDEKFLLYRYWVEKNREYVHEKSKGLLGYVHIPDMGFQGFAEFYRLFRSEFDRDGLIVDVRFNRGGFISGLILQKLLLKREGYDVPRHGKKNPIPFFSSPKVLVAITNENAGSDGDVFSYLFKKYKLGVLIGKRTWGGVIGISPRHRLADKSTVTQPEFALHFDDIGLGIENYGVDPDIEVEIKPEDYANEKDTQLDKAIELALKQLNK
ncbi:peptidase [Sulfolobus sp. E1]|nr:peptidase [Sulfolobus sp. E1]